MSAGVTIPGLSKRLRGALYDHVYDNHTHEVGGVLVGDLGEGAMPVVSGCIAALEARGERASVTFTHDAWSSIHAQMESDYPGKQIVGWYHSHPGFGVFLSGHDIFIQENFFSDPRQIAYVVDPHAGTEGVFGWRAGKVALIEEAPAGRHGTGGTDPGSESPRSSMARYGGLAAVFAVFLGIGGGLVLSGRNNPSVPPPAGGSDVAPGGAMRSLLLASPVTPPNVQTSTVPTTPLPPPLPPVGATGSTGGNASQGAQAPGPQHAR